MWRQHSLIIDSFTRSAHRHQLSACSMLETASIAVSVANSHMGPARTELAIKHQNSLAVLEIWARSIAELTVPLEVFGQTSWL